MSDLLPTVTVNINDEPVVINESDLTNDHELWEADTESETPNEGTKDWYKLQLDNAGLAYSPKNTVAELKEFCKGIEAS